MSDIIKPMSLEAEGRKSFKAFVEKVSRAIEIQKFDLVLAASDSGNIAAHITKEIYKAKAIQPPCFFIAPIYRHTNRKRTILFDNTTLSADFTEWSGRNYRNALFVDDEIWKGATLGGLLDLTYALDVQIDHCLVVAEDGGFNCPNFIQSTSIDFESTKQRIPGVYNLMSYIIPSKYIELFNPLYGTIEPHHHKQIMCTLLGLPVKEWNGGCPIFSCKLLYNARFAIDYFDDVQVQYKDWLKGEVTKLISGSPSATANYRVIAS